MDDPQVHTTPNHQPSKMDVLPKTFLQIILAINELKFRPLAHNLVIYNVHF